MIKQGDKVKWTSDDASFALKRGKVYNVHRMNVFGDMVYLSGLSGPYDASRFTKVNPKKISLRPCSN